MAREEFRHLTRAEIQDIVVSFHGGETQTSIASRHKIDRSTVHYHLKKYERAYPEEGGVYAVVKVAVKRICLHPSLRCTCCGEMQDTIQRQELGKIRKLERQLEDARRMVRAAGLAVESA